MGVVVLASLLSARAAEPALGMARVPSGDYRPLYRAVTDASEVPVKSFDLDVLPVTNTEFLKFVRANPRWQRSQVKKIFADESYLKHWAGDLELGAGAPTNTPVVCISWFAAKAYAQWKGKRLPTIAEWECAAMASPDQADGTKDAAFKQQVLKWYSTLATTNGAVGVGRANYFGIHDLHGLVWEWVADFNTAMVTGDARGDSSMDRTLFCGAGSVGAKEVDNFPAFMRYGFRSSLNANYCVQNLGFRCAKDL